MGSVNWRMLCYIGIIMGSQACDPMTDRLIANDSEPVPVLLGVGEYGIDTRAPVSILDATNISSVGLYAVREGVSAGQFPWTPSPYVSNVAPSGITGTQLSFSPVLYYPLGGTRLTFYGYYPRTTATSGANYITAPGNGTAPVYNFTITGQEDIMYAVSAPVGSANPSVVSLTFNHKLTQIVLDLSVLSGTLSSVQVVGTPYQGTLNIGTGQLAFNASPTTNFTITFPLLSKISNPIMLPAGVASYKVSVALLGLLTTNYTIKPTGDATFLAGKKYTVTF